MFASRLTPGLDLAAHGKFSVSPGMEVTASPVPVQHHCQGRLFPSILLAFPSLQLVCVTLFSLCASLRRVWLCLYCLYVVENCTFALSSHLATFPIGQGKPVHSASPRRASVPIPCSLQWDSTKSPLFFFCQGGQGLMQQ